MSKQHGTHLSRGWHSCHTPRHPNEHKCKNLHVVTGKWGVVKARFVFCNSLVLPEQTQGGVLQEHFSSF